MFAHLYNQGDSVESEMKNRQVVGGLLLVITVGAMTNTTSWGAYLAVIGVAITAEFFVNINRCSNFDTPTAVLTLTLYLMYIFGLIRLEYIRHQHNGVWWLAAIMLGVAATDIGALVVGRRIPPERKIYLARQLSPNKSVQGARGGIVAGFMVCLSITYVGHLIVGLSLWRAIYMSFGLPYLAIAGDLFESTAKRRLGIKDFSRLLGTHGGVADRFDAQTFVTALLGALAH